MKSNKQKLEKFKLKRKIYNNNLSKRSKKNITERKNKRNTHLKNKSVKRMHKYGGDAPKITSTQNVEDVPKIADKDVVKTSNTDIPKVIKPTVEKTTNVTNETNKNNETGNSNNNNNNEVNSSSKVSDEKKCIFKTIPDNLAEPKNIINMLYVQQQNFVKLYFSPKDNEMCLAEAKIKLVSYLKAIFTQSKNEQQLQILINLWNNNLPPANNNESLQINIEDVKSSTNSNVKNNTIIDASGNNVVDATGNNVIDASRNNVVDASGNNVVDANGNNVVDASGNNVVDASGNKTMNDAIKSLDHFDCDPSKIDITVPDNKDDAINKINTIDSYLITCSNNENEGAILDKWLEYLDDYKEKFGDLPADMKIVSNCKNLFTGNMDYNNVPDTFDDAVEKSLQYVDLLTEDEKNNDNKCKGSILAALEIFSANMDEKFPPEDDDEDDETSTNQTAPTDQSQPLSQEKISNIYNTLITPDKNTISLPKFINFMTNTTNEDSITIRKAIGFDEPLTKKEILNAKDNSTEDIVNFSKNAQLFNSLWKTFKEYNGNQKGGSDDEVPSNVTEMNLDQFSQFVNCGQYRNKDEYIFDCKNINIPEPSTTTDSSAPSAPPAPPAPPAPSDDSTSTPTDSTSTPTDSTSTPTAAPTDSATPIDPSANSIQPENPNNIELQINEKDFNGSFKRVDVSIFIPTDGKVVVRNYSKDTAEQTMAGLSTYGP